MPQSLVSTVYIFSKMISSKPSAGTSKITFASICSSFYELDDLGTNLNGNFEKIIQIFTYLEGFSKLSTTL